MTWVAVAVAGATVVGGMMASDAQQSAADTAANAQTQSAQLGIEERRRQFDSLQGMLSPFVQAATGVPAGAAPMGGFSAPKMLTPGPNGVYSPQPELPPSLAAGTGSDWASRMSRIMQLEQGATGGAMGGAGMAPAAGSVVGVNMQPQGNPQGGYMAPGGGGSLRAQQDVIGLNGAAPQQAAIDRLQTMPAFTSALKLGENRILQNASATGGLRGGNTQGALAYFAPQLLAQQINDYYGRLGGITSLGQNAAAMVGNAGMQTGAGIADLYGQAGSAQAGAALAGGRAQSNLYSSMGGALGQYLGMGGGGFGGGGITPDAIQGQFAQTGIGSSGFGTGLAYGNQDYGAFL